MATAEEFSVIRRIVRETLNASNGEFRRIAAESNTNLARIVKDLAASFRSQRRDIADLEGVMSENLQETQEMSFKIDRLAGIFSESLTQQVRMTSELENIAANINILNKNTETLENSMINALTGSSGSVVSAIRGLPETIKLAGGLALAGAGLSALGSGGGGGGGGSYKEKNEFYDAIISSEGTGRDGDPYNTSLGYRKSPKPLTQMTMKESLAWGEEIARQEMARTGKSRAQTSSAKGAFQIVNQTQIAAMKALNIGENELFSQENQKKMASWIAHTQGLGAWEGLKIHPDKMRIAQQAMQEGADKDFSTQVLDARGGTTSAAGDASRVSPIGEGHGPVSGGLPSGDIVGLGHALETRGFRISEHPAFGRVGHHAPGSAHYSGRAIDINIGNNNVEADNPEMAARFDQLAEELKASGYKVIWRAPGHYDHLHAQLARGTPATPSINEGHTPESALHSGMTEGLNPVRVKSVPVSESLLGKRAEGIDMSGATLQPPVKQAEIIPNKDSGKGNVVNKVAVEKAAQQEIAQETKASPVVVPQHQVATNSTEKLAHGYGYNHKEDRDLAPSWAAKLGGYHYAEAKNFKENMWG